MPASSSAAQEAGEEAGPELVLGAVAGVDAQQRSLARDGAVAGRPAEDLGPVGRQAMHVIGVGRVRERVLEHRVGEASGMVGGGQRLEGRHPAGGLVDRRTGHGPEPGTATGSSGAARAPAAPPPDPQADRQHRADEHHDDARQPQVEVDAVARASTRSTRRPAAVPSSSTDGASFSRSAPRSATLVATAANVGSASRELGRGLLQLGAEVAQLGRDRLQSVGDLAQVVGRRVAIAGDEPLDGLQDAGHAVGQAGQPLRRHGQVVARRFAELIDRRRCRPQQGAGVGDADLGRVGEVDESFVI